MKFALPLLLLLTNLVLAQDYPRDTSYTIQSAYTKIKKKHSFITRVAPDLPAGVIAKSNVVYADVGRELHLDVFYPSKKTALAHPGILLIHGGGWSSGAKENLVPMAQQLAARGYVAVAVEYRLSPEKKYPAAVHDLKSAIRWMRANAFQFNLDTARIAALGCSSGAQLATLLGTTNGMPEFEGGAGKLFFSSKVQAIVNIDGIVSFTHPESEEGRSAAKWLGGDRNEVPGRWKAASPLEYVNQNTPPTLFVNSSFPRFHAGRDDMVKILAEHSTYFEVHTLSGSPHSFWLVYPWFKPTLEHTASFLDSVFK